MALVPGLSGDTPSTRAKRQPAERPATGFFGWGGFVNFYRDGAGAGAVQNVANVFAVNGLGQDRSEYPVGAPADDAESYELGRIMTQPVSMDSWLSRDDAADPDDSHNQLIAAFDTNAKLNLVVGLGDNSRLFAFAARVSSYTIDASLDSAVRFQVMFRPSGKLVRLDPI